MTAGLTALDPAEQGELKLRPQLFGEANGVFAARLHFPFTRLVRR